MSYILHVAYMPCQLQYLVQGHCSRSLDVTQLYILALSFIFWIQKETSAYTSNLTQAYTT